MTAPDLLQLKIMDAIVPEPEGGAHTDPLATAQNLKTAIVTCFEELFPLGAEELLAKRYERFRMFGTADLQPVLPQLEEKND
jgi:acetyl-CoA carboxylase alpha subunit